MYKALVISCSPITVFSEIIYVSILLISSGVAETLISLIGLIALIISFALLVLFSCSSSIITINFNPALWASAILSNKFLRSPSLIAIFPFLVIDSQLMKYVVSAENPDVNTSNKLPLAKLGANLSILSFDCSSKSPFPGVNQQKIY